MKKVFFLLATLFLTTQGRAQIVNGGFEQLRTDGSAAYWLPDGMMIIIVDTGCVNMGLDSVGFVTDEAHNGNYAYELRMGYNCGYTFTGDVHPTHYISDTGFADQRVYFAQRPTAISFYYKLLPVANDYGLVTVAIENDQYEITGTDSIQLAPATNWALATMPINYTTNDTDGYMRLRFAMANDTGMHFGSRLLIDDVSATSGAAGIGSVAHNGYSMNCAATPAGDRLFINLTGAVTTATAVATIRDVAGKAVRTETVQLPGNHGTMDIAALPQGAYFLQVVTDGKAMMGRFIK